MHTATALRATGVRVWIVEAPWPSSGVLLFGLLHRLDRVDNLDDFNNLDRLDTFNRVE